jgi:hypothetical protein
MFFLELELELELGIGTLIGVQTPCGCADTY